MDKNNQLFLVSSKALRRVKESTVEVAHWPSIIEARSEKRLQIKAFVKAGSIWPMQEGWKAHGLVVCQPKRADVETLMMRGTVFEFFAVSAQTARISPQRPEGILHINGIFLHGAMNEEAAKIEIANNLHNKFPRKDGWRCHSIIASQLSNTLISKIVGAPS